MNKSSLSLGSIPDDLVLDILKHLDTARDVAHFEATAKWTSRLVRQSGWRDFVKTRFSSLGPPNGVLDGTWGSVADRLTYLDRCWNRRGFYLTAYDEIPPVRSARRRSFAGQSVGFQSVMTEGMVSSCPGEEIFVFGAGEDILVRRRPTHSDTQDVWAKLAGREMGYAAGTGDVTALSILERGSSPEIVVGRATGDLQLISADFQTLGDSTQTLLPLDEPAMDLRTSPGQVAVSWTEWNPRSQILASCRNSTLTLYNLGDSSEETPLQPITFYDAARDAFPGETSFMRSVKFMGPDVIAFGMGGCYQPLRWAHIRPEGLQVFNAANNSKVEEFAALEQALREDGKTTVRAIEPVLGMNPNVLLSAWDDGSHRLSDLRTPADDDALYRDRFQLYQASGSMLVYGSERFVAGNNWSPSIRLFDFRFPRSYQHFNALPCSPYAPIPSRPSLREKFINRKRYHGYKHQQQQHLLPYDYKGSAVAKCEHKRGARCVWHALSAEKSWQPDALLHMGGASLDRVSSLSKASNSSSSFHVGFRGSFLEVTLGLAGHISEGDMLRTAPEGWRATQPKEKVSLMETGMGLCGGEFEEELSGMPRMFYHKPWPGNDEVVDDSDAVLSRLDDAYRTSYGRRVWERGIEY